MKNIIHYLYDHAKKFPDKTAYRFWGAKGLEDDAISYTALYDAVRQLAFRLMDQNPANELVLLLYQNTRDFIISFFACQYAGIVAVPAPFPNGGKQFVRLQNIIADAEITTLLCTSHSVQVLTKELNSLPGARHIRFVCTDTETVQPAIRNHPEAVLSELSFIQYTSGSTGNPKGVIITSKNLLANQESIKELFGSSEDSVIFSWLPFHHDMGLIGNILHTIYVGAVCIMMSPFEFMQRPASWLEGISRFRVTHSGGPNFAYDHCIGKIAPGQAPDLDLSSWKVAYNGSEPVSWKTMQDFADKFAVSNFSQNSFFPCYGLSESTLLVSGRSHEDNLLTVYAKRNAGENGKLLISENRSPDTQQLVSAGKTAAGMEVKIISEMDHHQCGEQEEGEICISGESVTSGYWGKDNSNIFYEVDGRRFLRTGDLGYFYKEQLFICGRIKEMMIVRGRNIFPIDIEQDLAESIACIESNGVAIFSPDEIKESLVVVAEIKRESIKELDIDGVVRAMDAIVMGRFGAEAYDIVLVFPRGIPRTTSGKLQRVRCKEMYRLGELNGLGSKKRDTLPGLKMEKEKRLKEDVLSDGSYDSIRKYLVHLIGAKTRQVLETVSDATALTDLGIDSLRATELVNFLNKELQMHLDAASVLQDNSMAGFIGAIESNLWLRSKPVSGKEIML
jgi:acyl-CoA synthetase (AMP-forming)/AMP-acid ligase II/acyl carrier protein